MKTVVLVIAEDVFRDEEYTVPKAVLEAAGLSVITASTTTTEARGKLGLRVKPDILTSDIDVNKLDALVFVGGGGASQYFHDGHCHKLANRSHQLGHIVGAICIAPVILANAGLLTGRRATVFPDGADTLVAHGANYTAAAVEVDGGIVTGNGPEAAQEFSKRLLALLQET